MRKGPSMPSWLKMGTIAVLVAQILSSCGRENPNTAPEAYFEEGIYPATLTYNTRIGKIISSDADGDIPKITFEDDDFAVWENNHNQATGHYEGEVVYIGSDAPPPIGKIKYTVDDGTGEENGRISQSFQLEKGPNETAYKMVGPTEFSELLSANNKIREVFDANDQPVEDFTYEIYNEGSNKKIPNFPHFKKVGNAVKNILPLDGKGLLDADQGEKGPDGRRRVKLKIKIISKNAPNVFTEDIFYLVDDNLDTVSEGKQVVELPWEGDDPYYRYTKGGKQIIEPKLYKKTEVVVDDKDTTTNRVVDETVYIDNSHELFQHLGGPITLDQLWKSYEALGAKGGFAVVKMYEAGFIDNTEWELIPNPETANAPILRHRKTQVPLRSQYFRHVVGATEAVIRAEGIDPDFDPLSGSMGYSNSDMLITKIFKSSTDDFAKILNNPDNQNRPWNEAITQEDFWLQHHFRTEEMIWKK